LKSIWLIFVSASGLLSGQSEWLTYTSAHFKIFYTQPDQRLAQESSAIFEAEYANLSGQLDLKFIAQPSVFLAPTEHVFNEITGHVIPHWGEGVADPARNLIVLKPPDLVTRRDRFLKLVRHELTHVLVGQAGAYPHTIPRWFNEGIAIYFSYDEEFAHGAAISKALLSDAILLLDEIDDVLQFHTEQARLAYEESFSAILYLEKLAGFEGIVQIIHALQNGQSFNQAFREATGLDVVDFEMEWLKNLEKKYRWRFLYDFETYLWIIILLLFVLVFVGIKLRNRQVMKRWEQEERLAR
jgi:hypothetical protein